MTKKIYVDGFVVLPLHMYKRLQEPLTASSENVPDSQSSAYRLKYYHLFKQIHISESNVWYIVKTTVRTYKICVVKTTSKMLDWFNIWPCIMINMD